MQALADRPMTKRNDVPVKIDAEVVRVAKIAAAYKDMSLAEYISERLRPLVAEDIDREHEKRPHRVATKTSAKKSEGESKEGGNRPWPDRPTC
jgi:hypothetical protein